MSTPLDPQAILYRANRIYADHCGYAPYTEWVEGACKHSEYIYSKQVRAAIPATVEAINNQQQKEKE
jgi:hypothetical protein